MATSARSASVSPTASSSVGSVEGGLHHALAHRREPLGHRRHPRDVGRIEEERPQERAVHAIAEGEPRRAHAAREFVPEGGRVLDLGAEQRVPGGSRRGGTQVYTPAIAPGDPMKPRGAP